MEHHTLINLIRPEEQVEENEIIFTDPDGREFVTKDIKKGLSFAYATEEKPEYEYRKDLLVTKKNFLLAEISRIDKLFNMISKDPMETKKIPIVKFEYKKLLEIPAAENPIFHRDDKLDECLMIYKGNKDHNLHRITDGGFVVAHIQPGKDLVKKGLFWTFENAEIFAESFVDNLE